jgi:hypothetical protein
VIAESAQSGQTFAACEERHVSARLLEPAAIEQADRPRTHHCNAHLSVSLSVRCQSTRYHRRWHQRKPDNPGYLPASKSEIAGN